MPVAPPPDVFPRELIPILFGSFQSEQAEAELDFILETINLEPPAAVLDAACGAGRHAISLAERGFAVTGVDISRAFLREAARRGRERGVAVQWREGDLRDLRPWHGSADLVLNIWTSVGYYPRRAQNLKCLKELARCVAPGGYLVYDTRNPRAYEQPLNRWYEAEDGTLVLLEGEPDRAHRRFENRWLIVKRGKRREVRFTLDMIPVEEIEATLKGQNLVLKRRYGGFDGQRYRARSPRYLVIARRPA